MGKLCKRVSIDELKRLAGSELQCVSSKAARGDEDATICALCRDDPKKLSDALDRDLPIQPVLALDNHPFAAADELEVDTTIGLASAALTYGISLLAVGLTDKEFKVRPTHLPERRQSCCPGEQEALPPPLANPDQTGG